MLLRHVIVHTPCFLHRFLLLSTTVFNDNICGYRLILSLSVGSVDLQPLLLANESGWRKEIPTYSYCA